MNTITLLAPLSGRILPLESIPDPIFAQKMAGEGLAIDPTSTALVAPCDGEITKIHSGQHALTLASNNIEIIIHIGLQTARLEGEGFMAHVKQGSRVKAGQILIEFDPDYIATHAASLLTVILVSNPERIEEFFKSAGDVQAGQDVLMELTLVDYQALAAAGIYKPIISEAIQVPNPNGLHLRPAAVLSSLSRGFTSDIFLIKGDEEANAKSVTSIMALDVQYKDDVRLSASGPDAYDAIGILTPAIVNGLGEEGSTPIQAPASIIQPAIAAPLPLTQPGDPQIVRGQAGAAGLAVGYVFQLRPVIQEIIETAKNPLHERERLNHALAQTRLHLEALRSRTQAESNPGQAAMLAAIHELLDDPELMDMAFGAIERGNSAEFAWMAAANAQAVRLERLHSAIFDSRAADLRELGRRVANEINHSGSEDLQLPPRAIVIVEDISAESLAKFDRERIRGVVAVLCSPMSAMAQQARELSIPTITAAETRALDITNGTSVILDGTKGTLHLNPTAEAVAEAKNQIQDDEEQQRKNLSIAFQIAKTAGGAEIEVQSPLSTIEEAQLAMQKGADGICWASTEHLFTNQRTPPTEDEQTIAYVDLANAAAPGKRVTIRTLNISSRQPLRFLPQAPELNPKLGLSGIRFTTDHPQLLRKQCRAIIRAAAETERPLQILLPMVATMNQWRKARQIIQIEQEKMEIEPVPIGLLIQAPAAAIFAEHYAREADFLVIDANDLSQYALAMDGNNPHLAAKVDALDPAVLQLIYVAIQGAKIHQKPITLSGAIATDPTAIPILIGLGITGLNVHPNAVPNVKAQIDGLEIEKCGEMGRKAMEKNTAQEVRNLV